MSYGESMGRSVKSLKACDIVMIALFLLTVSLLIVAYVKREWYFLLISIVTLLIFILSVVCRMEASPTSSRRM